MLDELVQHGGDGTPVQLDTPAGVRAIPCCRRSGRASKPLQLRLYEQAEADVDNFIETHRYFANLAQNLDLRTVIAVSGDEAAVVRHPWGPCGFIVPWNFPFLVCGWGIGPASAAGNTCVV